MTTGAQRSIIGGLLGPRACTPRSVMVGSSGMIFSSLEGGLDTVTRVPVSSNDPCWSSFHLCDSGGGSILTGGRPRILVHR
jgi:hypothetical protein